MAPRSPRITTWRSPSGPTPAPCASSRATRRCACAPSRRRCAATRASDVPKLLVNPRATVSYGADTLRFYVEAYGERPGARLVARALDPGGHEIWRDTVALAGTEALATGLALLRPGEL